MSNVARTVTWCPSQGTATVETNGPSERNEPRAHDRRHARRAARCDREKASRYAFRNATRRPACRGRVSPHSAALALKARARFRTRRPRSRHASHVRYPGVGAAPHGHRPAARFAAFLRFHSRPAWRRHSARLRPSGTATVRNAPRLHPSGHSQPRDSIGSPPVRCLDARIVPEHRIAPHGTRPLSHTRPTPIGNEFVRCPLSPGQPPG